MSSRRAAGDPNDAPPFRSRGGYVLDEPTRRRTVCRSAVTGATVSSGAGFTGGHRNRPGLIRNPPNKSTIDVNVGGPDACLLAADPAHGGPGEAEGGVRARYFAFGNRPLAPGSVDVARIPLAGIGSLRCELGVRMRSAQPIHHCLVQGGHRTHPAQRTNLRLLPQSSEYAGRWSIRPS